MPIADSIPTIRDPATTSVGGVLIDMSFSWRTDRAPVCDLPPRVTRRPAAATATTSPAPQLDRDVATAPGELLTELSSEWFVLHDVPMAVDGTVLDHLLVGPAGVFAITVGHTLDAFRDGAFNARRAATLLSDRARFEVEVHGLVAIDGWHLGPTRKTQPTGETVTGLAPEALTEYLTALPDVLGPPSVARIYAVARHLATWQPKTVAWSDDF